MKRLALLVLMMISAVICAEGIVNSEHEVLIKECIAGNLNACHDSCSQIELNEETENTELGQCFKGCADDVQECSSFLAALDKKVREDQEIKAWYYSKLLSLNIKTFLPFTE